MILGHFDDSSSEEDDDDDYEGRLPRLTRTNLLPHEFKANFRMDKTTYLKLYDIVSPYFVHKKKTNAPISPDTAIMSCLDLLASGNFQGGIHQCKTII
jgi:hypothetical protein